MVGEGRADTARQFYRIAYALNWGIATVIIVLFAVAKPTFINLFTSQPEIYNLMDKVWPFLLLYIALYSTN